MISNSRVGSRIRCAMSRAPTSTLPCSWDEAFQAIGAELKALDPKSVIFYSSGRASLETSYLYGLFARALRQQ